MDNLTNKLTEQFLRIANKWSALNARPIGISEGFTVTTAEIHLIEAIGKHAGINVTELAKNLGVTKGAISQMVSALERKGILSRVKDGINKKTVLLRLTEKGELAAGRHEMMHEAINRNIVGIFNAFSREDVEKASDMLERVEAFFDAPDA